MIAAIDARRVGRGGADLHVHTTHSDGACTPGEVVRAAASVGLDAVAITDHDTVTGIAAGRREAARVSVELIAGIELTAEEGGREVHVLGYFIDEGEPALVAATEALRVQRESRARRIAERLGSLGFRVDLEAIRRQWPRAVLGRRHLADWLVRTGQADDHRSVFAGPLANDGPAMVAHARLGVTEAIGLVHGAGGVAALAHPRYDATLNTVAGLKDQGLDAIEVEGPGIRGARRARLSEWAGRLDLIAVAGTDFHAPDRPGRWVGAITTPREGLEGLRARAARTTILSASAKH